MQIVRVIYDGIRLVYWIWKSENYSFLIMFLVLFGCPWTLTFLQLLMWSLPVHFFDQVVKLLSEHPHSFLSFLSNFFSVLQLVLQQFLELFVFLLELFIFDGLFHQRVNTIGLQRSLLETPLIVLKTILQHTQLLLHFLTLLQNRTKLSVSKICFIKGLLSECS